MTMEGSWEMSLAPHVLASRERQEEGFYYAAHKAALRALPVAQDTLKDPKAGQACEKPTHWGASPSPGPPLGLQIVMGVELLDSGEKRARSVPEKGVSGKAYRSDPSVAL